MSLSRACRPSRAARVLLVACTVGLVSVVPCQAPAQASTPAGARSALRELDPADLSFWKNIRNATTSNDGKWFAYVVAPNEGDAEVVIRPTAAEGKERRFAIGEPPVGGGGFGSMTA